MIDGTGKIVHILEGNQRGKQSDAVLLALETAVGVAVGLLGIPGSSHSLYRAHIENGVLFFSTSEVSETVTITVFDFRGKVKARNEKIYFLPGQFTYPLPEGFNLLRIVIGNHQTHLISP